jgi:hypothetical protein
MPLMTNTHETQPRDDRSLKFAGNSQFQVEVRRRIDEFSEAPGGGNVTVRKCT